MRFSAVLLSRRKPREIKSRPFKIHQHFEKAAVLSIFHTNRLKAGESTVAQVLQLTLCASELAEWGVQDAEKSGILRF